MFKITYAGRKGDRFVIEKICNDLKSLGSLQHPVSGKKMKINFAVLHILPINVLKLFYDYNNKYNLIAGDKSIIDEVKMIDLNLPNMISKLTEKLKEFKLYGDAVRLTSQKVSKYCFTQKKDHLLKGKCPSARYLTKLNASLNQMLMVIGQELEKNSLCFGVKILLYT